MQQTNFTQKQKQAFTLIELLAVITIIAILMGLVVGVSGVVTGNAAEAKIKAQLSDLALELDKFKNDEGHYPASGGNGIILGFMDWYEDKYPDTIFTMIETAERSGQTVFIDPWGSPVIYKDVKKHTYHLGSKGPNRKTGGNGSSTFGDGDDITNRNGGF